MNLPDTSAGTLPAGLAFNGTPSFGGDARNIAVLGNRLSWINEATRPLWLSDTPERREERVRTELGTQLGPPATSPIDDDLVVFP